MEKLDRGSSSFGPESDEVSLVDLAKIVIKWRRLELAVWGLCILAGLAYAVLVPRAYQYSSVYQMAMEGDKPLEAPAGLLSKIQNFYEPSVYQALSKGEGQSPVNALKLDVSNPDSTALLVLHSKASKPKAGLVRSVHKHIVEKVEQEQTQLLNRKESALKTQLKSLDEQLKDLKQGSGEGLASAIATTMSQKSTVQQNLANLSPGQALAVAQPSLKPKGPSRLLVVILAVVLGAFLALLVGFAAEFLKLVKASYED